MNLAVFRTPVTAHLSVSTSFPSRPTHSMHLWIYVLTLIAKQHTFTDQKYVENRAIAGTMTR